MLRCVFLFLCTLPLALVASAHSPIGSPAPMTSDQKPEQLKDVGVRERLGENISLDTPFVDDEGRAVTLRDYFHKGRPVLMTIIYYGCPNLCNYHLNGLNDALQKLKWTTGKEFEFVAISMDDHETPKLAKEKKEKYLAGYGRVDAGKGWHFLTGTEENIRKFADQVGFSFRWDEQSFQFAHTAAAYVLTPEGKISRYLYGISFEPQTLRLALNEAASGKVGGIIDRILLYCFHFNPVTNKYSLYIFNVLRLGAAFTLAVLAIFLIPAWLRERRRSRLAKGET